MSSTSTSENTTNPVPLDDKPTVLTLIRQLQSGAVAVKSISARDRQACVAHLIGDGYSTVEVAEILKVSERTIARDKRAIQEANALSPDPALVGQMAGRLFAEAESCITRIRRAARDKTTPPFVKVEAESRCWQITKDLTNALQQLGYLPTAATRLEASLTHSIGDIPNASVIEAQLKDVVLLQQKCRPDDTALAQVLRSFQEQTSKLLISDQIAQTQINLSKEADP